MTEWKRLRPIGRGEYKSELGRIKKNKHLNYPEWNYTAPNGEITTHTTLIGAQEYAESEDWKGGVDWAKDKAKKETEKAVDIMRGKLEFPEPIPDGWSQADFDWANQLAEKKEMRTDILNRINSRLGDRRKEVLHMLRTCANELENVALFPGQIGYRNQTLAETVRTVITKAELNI